MDKGGAGIVGVLTVLRVLMVLRVLGIGNGRWMACLDRIGLSVDEAEPCPECALR